MLDDIVGFLFSALLGLGLLVVVLLLARRSMVREMKQERDPVAEEKGERESQGQSGSSDAS